MRALLAATEQMQKLLTALEGSAAWASCMAELLGSLASATGCCADALAFDAWS